MVRKINARTSGTTGEPKTITIGSGAVLARCEALEPHMRRAGQTVACSFNDVTTIHQITAGEAVKHVGGTAQEWPGDETTTLLITNYSPVLKVLRDRPDIRKNLKEIWFARIFKQELADRIRDMSNVPVRNYYGTSETGCIAIDGEPLAGLELDVRNGVLWVRSETLADGCADAGGWYCTRDHVDFANGKLAVLGRVT